MAGGFFEVPVKVPRAEPVEGGGRKRQIEGIAP